MKFSAVTWFGFLLAAVCFCWFLGTADYAELTTVFLSVNLWCLPVLLFLNLIIFLGRALRWMIILRHLGGMSFRDSFRFTTIGFGANVLLPARVGEFIKPYLAARHMDKSFSALFTTVILERILDLIVLMSLLAGTVAYIPTLLQGNPNLQTVVNHVSSIFAVITIFSLACCVLSAWYPEYFRRIVKKLERFMPKIIADKLDGLTDSFLDGVKALESPWTFIVLLLVSYGFWGVNLLFYWYAGVTAGFDMGLTGALIAMTVSAFAAALPQAPGYIGPFHVAMETALKTVGVATSYAKACAIITWAFAAVPVAITGFAYSCVHGISLSKVAEEGREAVAHQNDTDETVAGGSD